MKHNIIKNHWKSPHNISIIEIIYKISARFYQQSGNYEWFLLYDNKAIYYFKMKKKIINRKVLKRKIVNDCSLFHVFSRIFSISRMGLRYKILNKISHLPSHTRRWSLKHYSDLYFLKTESFLILYRLIRLKLLPGISERI